MFESVCVCVFEGRRERQRRVEIERDSNIYSVRGDRDRDCKVERQRDCGESR